MKLITVIIISVFTIASAIRVPATWPEQKNVQQMHHKFRTSHPSAGSEISFRTRPQVEQTQKYQKINNGRNYHQDTRYRNLKKPEANNQFKASSPMGDWKPIVPTYMMQKPLQVSQNHKRKKISKQNYRDDATYEPTKVVKKTPLRDDRTHQPVEMVRRRPPHNKNYRDDRMHQPTEMVRHSPLYKNYRDDRTHEPTNIETIEEKHIHREKPMSDHEIPPDVPTRPIYPGEGQWAIRGAKHRPYVPKPKQQEEVEEEDDEEETPEGYETYQKNQELFNRQRERFRQNVNRFPQQPRRVTHPTKGQAAQEEEEEGEESEEDDGQEFVPLRVYTQIRRTENSEHLPPLPEDPRLREVIKDSKIQTVYTEEGYEDLAYDHAGHEKTAEEEEGQAEFDKEIEREKQRKQKLADSDAAGSQHQSVKKPLKMKMKKDMLMKSKEVKTTSLKEKNNINTAPEMEVLSEIKILGTPENGTKTHKFVKIAPKMYEYSTVSPESENSTSPKPQEVSTTTTPELSPMETAGFYRSRFRRRFKRFTTDFLKTTVDTDFIDKINHDIPQVSKTPEKPKYPYYTDPSINPYSPLRYAEDLSNIPKKTEDEFAFYNEADRKLECQEVETDVNPIPEHVKDADEDPENVEDATDVQELVQMPRLKNLGDKIDCFKVKYFGENPLDSPFFSEKELGPVIPLFKLVGKNNKQSDDKVDVNAPEEKRSSSTQVVVQHPPAEDSKQPELTTEKTVLKLKLLEPQAKPDNDTKIRDLNILTDVINRFNNTTEVTPSLKLDISESKVAEVINVDNKTAAPAMSIITTPKYTIDLKPKHIYHQIELLQYLPQYNKTKTENSSAEPLRMGKELTESASTAPSIESPVPESQALIQRRQRPRPRPRRPPFQIFDVNKYLPRASFNMLNQIIRTNTIVPKNPAKSQVYYKDEIKASEQLNVFADVINNIKNSSRDPQQVASSNRITTTIDLGQVYRKIPVVEDLDDIEETNSFYSSTTTVAPRGTIKYSTYLKKHDQLNRYRAKYENLELLKVDKTTTTTEPYSSDTRISSSSNEEIVPEIQEDEDANEEEDDDIPQKVLGLMPPVPPKRYTTIVKPQLIKPSSTDPLPKSNNIYYVLGMKPPPLKQKIYLYSDFKNVGYVNNKIPYVRRGKRSAQRPSYSEVVRNRNKPIDVEDETEVVVEEVDDYVPHRPRNYHYDEKTGRIVYENVPKQAEAPEEEYIEVTDAPLPKPTRRNSAAEPRFENFTGPSYVDFIKKLKSNANYQEITDPPSTEKDEAAETTTTTTAKPAPTQPPEFLGFLSQLRSNTNYKAIPDKTTSKTTTTTEVVVEEQEEESQVENVRNSPGGQSLSQKFQIFDITEYLPKIKTYSPRTTIDYSKYKTIERASVPLRHNISSRYNSDERNTEISNAPVVMEERKDEPPLEEIYPQVSESKHEEVVPDVSTTTTTTTTTTTQAPSSTATTRRVRGRVKSRATRRTTTVAPVTTTSAYITEQTSPSAQNKPKRIYPRRRPTRIKVNKAATEVPDSEIEETLSAKVIRRRHQKSEDLSKNQTDINVSQASENQIENQTKTPNVSDVQVFRKYDPRKKHGGNYRKEKEDRSDINVAQESENQNQTQKVSKKDGGVQTFRKYDPTKKHGGNYRKEEDIELNQNVTRLTDIVSKPATYYTDPKLPKKINQLVEGQVQDVGDEEGGSEENSEGGDVAEFDYEESAEKVATEKKPVFVKDPDKRLYYYAPI